MAGWILREAQSRLWWSRLLVNLAAYGVWLSTLSFYFLWLQVLSKREQYGKLDKAVMSIWECCELLNEFVDESDPDLDEPQIEHLLQIAEAIRKDYPNEDWLHLTGLIHGMS